MRDYADRGYILGRVHCLVASFLRRSEYAAVLGDTWKHGTHENVTSGFESIFRGQIEPLISLIEASAYYRDFLIAVLRFAECLNALRFRHDFGSRDPGPWLDISPYNVLQDPLSPGAVPGGQYDRARGSFLEGFLPGEASRSAAQDFDELFTSYMGYLLSVAARYPARDRAPLLASCRILLEHQGMVRTYRLRDFYRINGRQAEDETGARQGVTDRFRGTMDIAAAGRKRQVEDISPPVLENVVKKVTMIYRREWNTASVVALYLVRVFMQIRNLFILAEGLRLGMDMNEIIQSLVCED